MWLSFFVPWELTGCFIPRLWYEANLKLLCGHNKHRRLSNFQKEEKNRTRSWILRPEFYEKTLNNRFRPSKSKLKKHAVGYTCAYGNPCITMMRWFQFIRNTKLFQFTAWNWWHWIGNWNQKSWHFKATEDNDIIRKSIYLLLR